jgi:hypothetical protein
MTLDFIPFNFPAKDITDGQYLYRSLGSFWTYIFQDKHALKGYTIGMAEEAIQAYYELIDIIKRYSVKEAPLLNKKKWQPLTIKKSEFNKTAFVFESDGAVFGYQPESDLLYANRLFRFGRPKETDGKTVFSFTPNFTIGKLGGIANRIISPSMLLIPGADIYIKNNTIYFNIDLFDNSYIPRSKLFDDQGKIITYTDEQGKVIEDEFIIMWVYNVEIDNQELYNNFGIIFDLLLPTSESYKDILKALINLAVEGPTIRALSVAFASLANTPVVMETTEKVEDIYVEEDYKYVITDKSVYKLPALQELHSYVTQGNTLRAGQPISTNILVVDTVIQKDWWKKAINPKKLAFPSYVFAANTKYQLFFENDIQLITYTGNPTSIPATDKIVFPVVGRVKDVASFQKYINIKENKEELIRVLNLSPGSSQPINPLEFVFNNFFKNNILLLKLDFFSEKQLNNFFDLFGTIQPYLPPHVYLLVYTTLKFTPETIDNLNNGLTISNSGLQRFSLDGSVRHTGARPVILNDEGEDTDYYHDYINRLFCVSLGPYRNLEPLHTYDNLDQLPINNNPSSDNLPGVKSGLLRTEIPASVLPPGEPVSRPPTTREIQSILLIDF